MGKINVKKQKRNTEYKIEESFQQLFETFQAGRNQ